MGFPEATDVPQTPTTDIRTQTLGLERLRVLAYRGGSQSALTPIPGETLPLWDSARTLYTHIQVKAHIQR